MGQTIKLDLTGCVFPDCRACESGDKGGPVYSGEFLDCRSTKPRAMTEKVSLKVTKVEFQVDHRQTRNAQRQNSNALQFCFMALIRDFQTDIRT